MNQHQAPFSVRFAYCLADAASLAVSLFRPLLTHTEEQHDDDTGRCTEATERCVYVTPLEGASSWRVEAWLDNQASREGCLHLLAFGCGIDIYYVRKGNPCAVSVG